MIIIIITTIIMIRITRTKLQILLTDRGADAEKRRTAIRPTARDGSRAMRKTVAWRVAKLDLTSER